jgi:hypothetical protein
MKTAQDAPRLLVSRSPSQLRCAGGPCPRCARQRRNRPNSSCSASVSCFNSATPPRFGSCDLPGSRGLGHSRTRPEDPRVGGSIPPPGTSPERAHLAHQTATSGGPLDSRRLSVEARPSPPPPPKARDPASSASSGDAPAARSHVAHVRRRYTVVTTTTAGYVPIGRRRASPASLVSEASLVAKPEPQLSGAQRSGASASALDVP